MISCLEWIPRNVADPSPKRYELSKVERELLAQEQKEVQGVEGGHDDDHDDGTDESLTEVNTNDEKPETNEEKGEKSLSASEIIAMNKIDPSTLPKDLRMDEYSDDEDDNDGGDLNDADIGDILIGRDADVDVDADADASGMLDGEGKGGKREINMRGDSDDSDEDDDFDDLGDIPDTREYLPTNIKGLEAMNFGGYNGIADFEGENDDDDSDIEDTNLKANDALIIVAKTEEDFASLEICVYEELTGNLFVHHDIPLPSFPLSLAHGTINGEGGAGNFVAVGTFDPGIEIWNADVLNVLEPTVMLGGEDTSAADAKWAKKFGVTNTPKPKFRSNNGTGLRNGSHTGAVMSLSWNQIHRQVLASGSADKTVKLWDITKTDDASGGVAATFTIHSDKVQSTAWHPTEGTILATGSYDQTVGILDARSPNGACKKVKIPADCEAIAWDPHHPHLLTAASEDGSILCWDVRKFESGSTYWNFVAHEFGGCSDISYNPNIPGMMISCAIDKTVAIWDTLNVGDHSDGKPVACGSKEMGVGKLYSTSFYPSSSWLLGCGGGGNQLALWDLSSETAFQNRFGGRLAETSKPKIEEKVIENNEEKDEAQTEDFEAIMAASDQAATEARQEAKNSKKKKKKTKKKVRKR